MKANEIFRIYGTQYKEMTKVLLAKTALAGRIPPGAKIGIKPNLVAPTPAQFGATTHPEVVAGIIEYLQEHGLQDICMLESSWVGDKTSDAYEYCGYRTLSETYQVPFFDIKKEKSHTLHCGEMDLTISDRVQSIGFLINVPVLKGHGQTKITCALKNLKGLIPDTEKRAFHRQGLHDPIAHLSLAIKQDFIVVDHICGDLRIEDGGNPVVRNCVMAATDPVLLDTYAARLLGYTPEDVPYIKKAHELGIGSIDLSACSLQTFDYPDLQQPPVITQATDPDPRELFERPEKDLVKFQLMVHEVEACSSCYASLIPALMRLEQEQLLDQLMAKLPEGIAIGQGYEGKTGPFGIGHCCRNFLQNVPGCPPASEAIYAKLVELINN